MKILSKCATPGRLELFSWLVAVLAIAFTALNHSGFIDHLRGLDSAGEVASRYDLSYGQGSAGPIYESDPAWPALIRLTYKYSKADLPRDRKPVVMVRDVALQSAIDRNVERLGSPVRAQWTAPTTPIFLVYRMWPSPGGPPISSQDVRVIGTIADLHDWIRKDSDDFRFMVTDIAFALLTLWFAAMISILRRRNGQAMRKKKR